MKKLLLILLTSLPMIVSAKEFSWVCAIEWTEDNPEWLFVYEDIKTQTDGNYRIFVKWEFPNETDDKAEAKQVWLISPDFERIRVMSSVGYNRKGKIVYTDNIPQDWKFILPDTYVESIVETTKGILHSYGK
ncbi:hypothetical protein [Bacteroides caecimuris]|uniref:hypothetical protein n=1 Tax=Bacteroides caecimuris TaxID=1796613 RepID=UPI00257374CB|nr:hypothetical protein [Bacteroides caecimuris]